LTVLLSIDSKYVEKILNETKKYEFRGWKLPRKVKFIYIYSSRIEKKIVARFEIKKVHNDTPDIIWEKFKYHAGVSKDEYFQYVNKLKYSSIYAIEIYNLISFVRPISLLNVDTKLQPPQKFTYLNVEQIKTLEGYFDK